MRFIEELDVAMDAARAAGEVIERHFNRLEELEFIDKAAGDIVSAADREADLAIAARLRSKFAGYGYHSEESKTAHRAEFTWVVDPLDGTNNFAIGIAQYSVSIALLRGEETVLGVVYDPVRRRLYSAESGGGARINGRALTVAQPRPSMGRVVALDVPYGGVSLSLRAFAALSGRVKRVLLQWAPALDYAMLAQGRIDAVVCLGAESEDKPAGLLLASEAGCVAYEMSHECGLRPYKARPVGAPMPLCIAARDEKVAAEIAELLLRAGRFEAQPAVTS